MTMSRPVSRAVRIVLYALAWVALLGASGLQGFTKDDPDRTPPAATTAANPSETRPVVLAPLYITFAGLQILDAHSTLLASNLGAREANPVVRSMLGSPPALIATKAGVTASAIFASERLWKRNKAAAILMMAGLNSVYAAVVAHNYAVAARERGGR
jgi:hypothetical protein